MGEVGVGREVNLVLFISLLKSIKSQKSWYKRHVNLVSVGLPEANSALRIHNQNVTTFALTTFGEANLSILTYLRNTQLYIILKRNWYFYYLMKTHERQSISDTIWLDFMKLSRFSSSFLSLFTSRLHKESFSFSLLCHLCSQCSWLQFSLPSHLSPPQHTHLN